MRKSDLDIVRHILNYCIGIEHSVERFGNDFDIFLSDWDYRNSVCMSLLQIGELTTKFSPEFMESTKETIEWHKIRSIRNRFAHAYGTTDFEIIWNSISTEIPLLRRFCEEELQQNK